ncbi:MAG: hypothetical protein V7K76_22950 [Nostoc sp.]|uniref:hypothetical protein n=1 Tax=Nostoc sp. TaxID=1180 RepID=UPI002FF9E36F
MKYFKSSILLFSQFQYFQFAKLISALSLVIWVEFIFPQVAHLYEVFMDDELRLGSVPAEEGYQQYGIPNYHVRAQNESKIYKKQLLRLFPIPKSLRGKADFQLDINLG